MSSITLYKFTGKKEEVNKAGHLTTIETISGEFRTEIDILAPVIDIKLTTTTTAAKIISECNYVYIAEFSRYYYVVGLRAKNASVVELSLAVDPLYSFKDQILANRCIIERQEKAEASNTYLSDPQLKCYNEPYVRTIEFTTGFTSDNFVLAVAGG